MFVTLPKIFDTMPGGVFIGAVFFIMVFFAALTSAISLMETVVSILMDKAKLNRRISCLVVFGGSLLLGVPSALGFSLWENVRILGMQFLDFFDFISNSLLMPITALLTAIFVGYILKPKAIIDEVSVTGEFKAKRLFSIVIRYVAPICLIAILVSSVLSAFGVVKI
jgi:NSS family neurotransmitter:Na+ symporter